MDLDVGKSLVEAAWTATTSNALSWGNKSDQARSALSQFWAGKGESYSEDPLGWDRLDLSAHKAWASLAEIGMVADNPPAQQKYQDEAQRAYAGAKDLAAAVNDAISASALEKNAVNSAAWFAEAKAHGIDDSLSAALMARVGNLIGGIPAWAWIVGGLGILAVLFIGRR